MGQFSGKINFGVHPTQSGQMPAILDLHYLTYTCTVYFLTFVTWTSVGHID